HIRFFALIHFFRPCFVGFPAVPCEEPLRVRRQRVAWVRERNVFHVRFTAGNAQFFRLMNGVRNFKSRLSTENFHAFEGMEKQMSWSIKMDPIDSVMSPTVRRSDWNSDKGSAVFR